jgi:hypothetical protein
MNGGYCACCAGLSPEWTAEAMLREIRKTQQVPGESCRRWFNDEGLDLMVWVRKDGGIDAFQLAYGKPDSEHALSWSENSGFRHQKVDDGEGEPGKPKKTPLLVPDGTFDPAALAGLFQRHAQRIDSAIAAFVFQKLKSLAG